MRGKANSDGFATFLDGFSRSESTSGYGDNSTWVAPHVPSEAPAGPSAALRQVLRALGSSGRLPLAEFLGVARLPFSTFADAVQTLRGVALVRLSGEPGLEFIELTPTGRQVTILEL